MEGFNINQIVELGNYDQFKLIVDLDINLIDSVEDQYGRTPLIICSKYKNSPQHLKIAEYLLEAGCDVNIKADLKWENRTALATACYYGNVQMVKMLMSSKSNLDLEDEQIQKACQIGIDRSNTECVNLILNELENRENNELKKKIEKNLEKSVYTNDIQLLNKTIDEIKENNFNLKQFMNSTTIISHTLLDRACRNANPELVKRLIDSHILAKPNFYTKYSPLYIVSHMGHYEIAELLVKKFPHLIQVETIEKFLPYHAVCSQGHLDILKLFINFSLKSVKSDLKLFYSKYYIYYLERVFSNPTNPSQKYQLLFDLNSLDANDQSALYHAVIANKYNICDYLLKLKVPLLSATRASYYEKNRQKINDLFANESFYLSVSSSKSSNDSFLDQLKSVFLDPKSYDPYYTINYSATEESKVDVAGSSESDESDNETSTEYFNPINVNQYSKFGLTCLHESIRAKNTKITDLLIKNGADPNLPVLDANMMPISTSLIEALKSQDDKLFYLILKNYSLDSENFNQCLNACLSCEYGFRAICYLLRYKIYDDTENKISKGKNMINGLSFNLADLGLPEMFESWILNSSLNYKTDLVKSSSINLKKFHLNTITKIDLSNNTLESLPMFLFTIDSLRYLKLSHNKLKSLPVGQTQYDNITLKKSWSYSSHQLEELDLDHNLLNKIPGELFALKGLRRINLSYNQIDSLPIEIWQSGLNEINLSHNRLSNLPVLANCGQLRGRNDCKRPGSGNLKPIIKPKDVNEQISHYKESRVDKANFWSQNSAIFSDIEIDEDNDKKVKKNSNNCKIFDLNLSHNNFKKIPECLSCIVPKLSKLNLSHNLIESMGAISDYPANLKFLDLSNNLIMDSGRILNSSFLKFIDMYLLGKSVELKKLDFCLLDNQFCYLNLSSGRARPREKSIQVNLRSSSNRRRARSQSRNPARNCVLQINPDKKLPFDLYLMNYKYRRIDNETDAFDFDEVSKRERENFLNSQNIQIFVEQLCPHKRHIKLESLKSLNLSFNKIKKLDIMFDLSGEGKSGDESDAEDESKKSKQFSPLSSKSEERANCISKLLFPNLTHLDISNNLVRYISSSVSYLENLSHLNASSNFELEKISSKLGWLTKLWNLDLKSCPNIKDVQLDALIKQKTKTSDVLGYLKSILDNSRPYNRVKLMFVGVQAIGKTTLLNKLRDESGLSSSKTNLSTVGIEINEWTYEKTKNAKPLQDVNTFMEQNQKNFGPITFRTWDFAGQKEYYTTHQYFISKRAVYLVCWKMTEQEKGINEIHHWLSNIQTRAPGSPCIIVGTHQDQLSKLKNYRDISNSLQRKIYEKFILPNSDSETTSAAYPPIYASIEISSKSGFNIKLLARVIYDVAAQMKVPGTKDQLLLEQKIPSTYIVLEECVYLVAKKLRSQSQNPVLKSSEYLNQIQEAISYLYPDEDHGPKLAIRFRDNNEILQATQFLHENGILIHYNDVALNDLFFLDPQWLCNVLSTVVAIREINPFAAKGIMKINDLQILFKGSTKLSAESDEIMTYITDLLGKFELALTWDNEHLLIPSLLPSEPMLKYSNQDIRINIMSKQKLNSILNMNNLVQSASYTGSLEIANQLYSGIRLVNSYSQNVLTNKLNLEFLYECRALDQNESLRRLYTLSYLPSGFFSRLIVRILCDSFLKDSLLELIEIEQCDKLDFKLVEFLSQEAEWKCWQTGLELKYMDFTLFRVKEIIQDPLIDLEEFASKKNIFVQNSILYKDCENEIKLRTINKQFCSFIECYASLTSFKICKISKNRNESEEILINIKLNKQIISKIFALIIEIMDSLLEDWYPDLGTRFMQDSKGDYLITRLAPCRQCVHDFTISGSNSTPSKFIDELDKEELEKLKVFDEIQWIYCFMLDDICYSVLKKSKLVCIKHGDQVVREMAPDLAFDDIEQKYLINQDNLKIEKLLGRGSFGSVFSGSLFTTLMNNNQVKVAVKILESISSKPNLSEQTSDKRPLTKNSSNFWNHRKSIRLAAKAYSVARQEIAILSSLKHENIVSMMGLCVQPLAIILELAPLGNLKDLIQSYKKKSQRLNPYVIQQVSIQISSCLVYLHSNKIIYRDLKADNILVWKFPMPDQLSSNLETQIKLADYSISRCVLPTGTKGFAGTPGFMAPEILKYNGEESYSEKVDCFSFAMVLYELITLKHPYEGQEQIKDIVLNGGRPLVKTADLTYPTLMLDLMCLCWLDNPNDRPSAEQILKYSKSYEFSHLMDVTILEDYNEMPLVLACINQENDDFEVEDRSEEDDESDLEEIEEEDLIDVWIVNNKEESVTQVEVLTYENKLNCAGRKIINLSNNIIETCCYLEKANQMWFIDSNKSIFVYCCKKYKKLNQYILDINPETSGKIVSVHPIEASKQIILATAKGFIIYLYLNETSIESNSDFKYFIQELGIECHCSLLIPNRIDNRVYDLWLGSSNSEVFVYSLKLMKITDSYLHTSSHHYVTNSNLVSSPFDKNNQFSFSLESESVNDNKELNVVLMKATQIDAFFLWSYIFPGSTIYLWNFVSKKIMSAYNCKKSFEDAEKTIDKRDFRIVDMEFLNSYLFCAINNGAVLVLKRLTLTPLQVFTSHVHQLYKLCSIQFETKLNIWSKHNKQNMTSQVKKTQNMLLSMGRALAPIHEDVYLSNHKYRTDALQNYANCLILNAWNCNHD